MNTDYSPLPQNRSTRHQPKKDNAIIFCIRIAEQCTSYLSPDITGEAALQDDVGSTTGIISGAFVRGTRYRNTICGLVGGQSYALKIEASRSNSTFGINYSGVSVSAAYSLIIIKA